MHALVLFLGILVGTSFWAIEQEISRQNRIEISERFRETEEYELESHCIINPLMGTMFSDWDKPDCTKEQWDQIHKVRNEIKSDYFFI